MHSLVDVVFAVGVLVRIMSDEVAGPDKGFVAVNLRLPTKLVDAIDEKIRSAGQVWPKLTRSKVIRQILGDAMVPAKKK